MISLATSLVTQQVRDNVNAALDDNRIGQGRFNKEFEERVAEYLDAKHAIAVCNGTIADIVAVAALRALRPDKTEVIVPALTFVAHANSVVCNGLTPVFVDVGGDCQIDVDMIEEKMSDKTLAIMPVNLLGTECNIEEINRLAAKYEIFVIEDNCEAFGLPCSGDISTYSFFPSHAITTGEGGMVVTNDDSIADMARKAMNHGRRGDDILDKFHFDTFGINGKMSNVLAAIGCAVVDTANEVIEKRLMNVGLLNKLLNRNWYNPVSPHCYPYRYMSEKDRDNALIRLDDNGVEARKLFSCLPVHEKTFEYLGHKRGDFPIAENLATQSLFVPIHQDLTDVDLEKIAELL